MSLGTRTSHPQSSHNAEAKIRAATGPCPNSASDKLLATVKPFVIAHGGEFTDGEMVEIVNKPERSAGVALTKNSSIRRALAAMRATGEIVFVRDGDHGRVWRYQPKAERTQRDLF